MYVGTYSLLLLCSTELLFNAIPISLLAIGGLLWTVNVSERVYLSTHMMHEATKEGLMHGCMDG
jgi:NADH:ubiquinone oxidoreductase subunit K